MEVGTHRGDRADPGGERHAPLATGAAALASALEKRPDHPATLYNLACAESLAGRADDALAHLSRALELKPEWTEMAEKDDDLAVLRRRSDWPASSA